MIPCWQKILRSLRLIEKRYVLPISSWILSKYEVVGFMSLYTLSLIIIVTSRSDLQVSFSFMFLFSFGARKINFKRICRVTALITSILLIFVILSSFLGVIPNYLLFFNDRSRHYLGFRYALNAPAFWFNNIIMYTDIDNPESDYLLDYGFTKLIIKELRSICPNSKKEKTMSEALYCNKM